MVYATHMVCKIYERFFLFLAAVDSGYLSFNFTESITFSRLGWQCSGHEPIENLAKGMLN